MNDTDRFIKVERYLDSHWTEVGYIGIPEAGDVGGFLYSDEYTGPPLTPTMDPAMQGSHFFPLSVSHQGHLRQEQHNDLHSVFAQALPGRWGDAVMASHVQSYARASPAEKLWLLGDRRCGALRFSPGGNGMLDRCIEGFEALDALRRRVNVFVERMMRAHAMPKGGMGTTEERWALVTNGGATPKCAYRHPVGDTEFIAKFNLAVTGAKYSTTRVEAALMRVSQEAQLATPDTHLIETPDGDAVLLSARFDVSANGTPVHKINAATALDLPLDAYGDYGDMVAWLRVHGGRPAEDIRDLYGRMMLNVQVHNTDDHLGQFEFLQSDDGRWRLAPNYDVLIDEPPKDGTVSRHALKVGDTFTPSITPELIRDSALQFGIEEEEALAITKRVLDAVDRLPDAMTRYRVATEDSARLSEITDTSHARMALAGWVPAPRAVAQDTTRSAPGV